MSKETQYQIYMLRVWHEGKDPEAIRFSLEDTKTGERVGFADLEEFITYLRKEFG